MGRSGFHPLRSAGAVLLAVACSVYEVPTDANNAPLGGSAGNAGAGVGGSEAGAGSTSSAGSGSGAVATGGTPPSNAGSSSGGTLSEAGAAGEMPGGPVGGDGGAPPVVDLCPDDPNKLEPGDCGCGMPEAPTAAHDDCQTLESLLVHRYDFEGTGTAVVDRVGVKDGVLAGGAVLSNVGGKGVVQLGGGSSGPYVDLPNGIISALTNATIESWVTWGGGNSWQRIFDFGDSTSTTPENNPASGKSYLFLTPKAGDGVARASFSLAGNSEETIAFASVAMNQTLSQVIVVADATADELVIYVNGAKVGEEAWTGALADINDVNAWLGRSQYAGDPELGGVFHEFRIYDAALSAAQIAASFKAGPDPQFLAD